MFDWNLPNVVGLTAGLLSFSAYILYIYSMVFGQTRPNRMTWWTLTAIGMALAASYYSSGARTTMWISISYVLGPLIISLLSTKYGEGGWSVLDRWCLVGVAISCLFWFIFKNPLISLIVNILVDFFALLPTVLKSYRAPKSEDKVAWTIETASNFLNMFAITNWSFGIIIYPLYLLTINFIVMLLLWRPQNFRKAQ